MTRSRRRSRKRGARPSGIHAVEPGTSARATADQPAGDDVEKKDLRVEVEVGRENMYTVQTVKIEAPPPPPLPAPAAADAQRAEQKVVAERINVDGGEGVVIFRPSASGRCTRYLLKEVFE